jgi:hypothetical protein
MTENSGHELMPFLSSSFSSSALVTKLIYENACIHPSSVARPPDAAAF